MLFAAACSQGGPAGGGSGGNGEGTTLDEEACKICIDTMDDSGQDCSDNLDACSSGADIHDVGDCFRSAGRCYLDASSAEASCLEDCGDQASADQAKCGSACNKTLGNCLASAWDSTAARTDKCSTSACIDDCFAALNDESATCFSDGDDCLSGCS